MATLLAVTVYYFMRADFGNLLDGGRVILGGAHGRALKLCGERILSSMPLPFKS